MKRLIFILLGAALTTGAMAQTAQKKAEMHKKNNEKQLEKAVAAKKEDKKDVGNDLAHLKIGAAVKDRKEVRAHRRDIHQKARHLKNDHGAKHPIIKAQKAVKEDKLEKKGKN